MTHPILEYRLHLGPPLSRRTVDCPMDVNYQRANTCYKQTEEATDWLSARAQCWSYGGDLGTIYILRKHFYRTKPDLTVFSCQIKTISFLTLHFDKFFML